VECAVIKKEERYHSPGSQSIEPKGSWDKRDFGLGFIERGE
jgi:hypothetical protein